MKNKRSLKKTLENILAEKDFDRLEFFKDAESWNSIPEKERELLSQLLVLQGEQQLKEGNNKVLSTFDLANSVSPNNPQLLLSQAKILVAQYEYIHCLLQAEKILKKVIHLAPTLFDAWHLWGITLINMGIFHAEPSYFQLASEKFARAQKILSDAGQKITGELLWNWGVCYSHQGKYSEEPIDYREGIEKFQEAIVQGLDDKKFWNDYGTILMDFGHLIRRNELILEAALYFRKAIALDPGYFEAWFKLALASQQIYQISGNDQLFREADESFEIASQLNSNNSMLWLKWALLYVDAGKHTKQLPLLNRSIDKFALANACEPDNPTTLSRWGEVLLFLGAHQENLIALREAQAKIAKSLEISPESFEIWHLYGSCLNELGYYFTDRALHQQAIEKFQRGLALNRKDPFLWHGLATAYIAIGEMDSNIEMLEIAVRYCAQAEEMSAHKIPQVWNDWGIALMKLAELSEEEHYIQLAVVKFEQAIRYHNEDPLAGPINPEWFYNFGCALDFLGDFEEDPRHHEQAIQVLTRVLELDPNYIYARFNLGLAFFHLGEVTLELECFQRAIDYFQEVLVQDNEDDMSWNEWGLALLHISQLMQDPAHPDLSHKLQEQAEAKFLHAIALGNTIALYNLARLYSLSGNISASLYFLERAHKQDSLPPLGELLHDDWLAPLQNTPAFRNFISYLTKKQLDEDSDYPKGKN